MNYRDPGKSTIAQTMLERSALFLRPSRPVYSLPQRHEYHACPVSPGATARHRTTLFYQHQLTRTAIAAHVLVRTGRST